MLCLWICLSVVDICFGFSDVSFRSSVMDGQKPILRMGPESDETETQKPGSNLPKEPDWVTNLRSNLKQAIKEEGFEDAKPAIKQMIDEADEELNGEHPYQIPALTFQPKNPMRSRPPKRYVPQWERELITYVRGLMQKYGKNVSLDPFVQPLVQSIERKHNVEIDNIDVNAYGQIIVTYKSLSNNGGPPGTYPQSPLGMPGY